MTLKLEKVRNISRYLYINLYKWIHGHENRMTGPVVKCPFKKEGEREIVIK